MVLGGRTAWSSTVTIPSANSASQQVVQARYWYDGQYVHNAKEDAAEVALRLLTGSCPAGLGGISGAVGAVPLDWNKDTDGNSLGSSTSQKANAVGVGAAWPRSPPSGRW
jgi:hypothetical protein